MRTIRVEARTSPLLGPVRFGTLLFDLETDPTQEHPLADDEIELRMVRLLVEQPRAGHAPDDQYERLGVPRDPAEVTEKHLLVTAQRTRADAARRPAPRSDEFPEGRLNLRTPLAELLSEPAAVEAVRGLPPGFLDTELFTVRGGGSLLQLAAVTGHPAHDQLTALAEELARLYPATATPTPAPHHA